MATPRFVGKDGERESNPPISTYKLSDLRRGQDKYFCDKAYGEGDRCGSNAADFDEIMTHILHNEPIIGRRA